MSRVPLDFPDEDSMMRRKGKRGKKAMINTTMESPFGRKGKGRKSKRGRRR